jgi:hypothetical protein
VELHRGTMSATHGHPGLRVDIELPVAPVRTVPEPALAAR